MLPRSPNWEILKLQAANVYHQTNKHQTLTHIYFTYEGRPPVLCFPLFEATSGGACALHVAYQLICNTCNELICNRYAGRYS